MTIESADSDEGAFVDGRGGHVSDDGLMWLADDGDVIFLSGEAAEDERFWADVVKTDAAERALFEATYLAVFPPKPGVDSRGDGDEWVGDRYTWHFSTPGRDPFT
ncbi:MAG: hypothetical protein NTX29_10465, partial [Actinobacteria bacterium]|nr:hypothetical protein [Actinomycetota bacterium]